MFSNSKCTETSFSQISTDSLCLQHACLPCLDLEIRWFSCQRQRRQWRQTYTPITLPLVHVYGVTMQSKTCPTVHCMWLHMWKKKNHKIWYGQPENNLILLGLIGFIVYLSGLSRVNKLSTPTPNQWPASALCTVVQPQKCITNTPHYAFYRSHTGTMIMEMLAIVATRVRLTQVLPCH